MATKQFAPALNQKCRNQNSLKNSAWRIVIAGTEQNSQYSKLYQNIPDPKPWIEI